MNPRARGYLTQCDRSVPVYRNGKLVSCEATTRLDKPAKWRCEACTRTFGPLPKPVKP